MIGRIDIEQRVREWNLRADIVEKDYVLGWLLWGIGTEPVFRETWAFKGGTCLQKVFGLGRYSEDLDFTLQDAAEPDLDALCAFLSSAGLK